MNPAAAASLALSGEYTRALTTLELNARPAAKNPTTCKSKNERILSQGCGF